MQAVPQQTDVSLPLMPRASVSAPALDQEGWPRIVDQLGLKGMARELAQHSAFNSFEGGLLVLHLPATHRQLLMPASEQRMTQMLSELLGEALRIRFDVVDQVGVTAAVLKKEAAEERQNNAVEAIESDPLVRELIDVFDAKLIDGSIRPVTD